MLSLSNRAVSTVPQAMDTPSLTKLAATDRVGLVVALSDLLTEADGLIGSGMAPEILAKMAGLLVDDFGGRTVGNVLLAVQQGVKSKTIGHKLTYPILCEWMYDQDARVEEHNYNQYLSTK